MTDPTANGVLVHVLKSKIHRATITAGDVNYEGSMTIDQGLMELIGLHPYERIMCSNLANGNRFETYAIPGARNSGDVILNGAAAFQGQKGERLTIMSFTWIDALEAGLWKPRVIVLGDDNRPVTKPQPVACAR